MVILRSQSRGNWIPKSKPCSNRQRAERGIGCVSSLEKPESPPAPGTRGPKRKQCRFSGIGKDNFMILGLSIGQFTYLHVFLSMVGIGAGVFVVFGLLSSRRLSILTSLFFVTTVTTSLTGFLFPFKGVTPAIVVGILSLIALALAIVGLYVKKLDGSWRGVYVISVMVAFYFNFFVLIVQSFGKVHVLSQIAPTQTSPGFGLIQLIVLLIFVFLTLRAFKRFHPV
jgi:hypothetical protein